MALNIVYYEVYQVASDYVTADQIIWQRYKRRAPGVLERMLDDNPQMSVAHRTSPFLPPGMLLRLPIDPSLLLNHPLPASVNLWTDKAGYSL